MAAAEGRASSTSPPNAVHVARQRAGRSPFRVVAGSRPPGRRRTTTHRWPADMTALPDARSGRSRRAVRGSRSWASVTTTLPPALHRETQRDRAVGRPGTHQETVVEPEGLALWHAHPHGDLLAGAGLDADRFVRPERDRIAGNAGLLRGDEDGGMKLDRGDQRGRAVVDPPTPRSPVRLRRRQDEGLSAGSDGFRNQLCRRVERLQPASSIRAAPPTDLVVPGERLAGMSKRVAQALAIDDLDVSIHHRGGGQQPEALDLADDVSRSPGAIGDPSPWSPSSGRRFVEPDRTARAARTPDRVAASMDPASNPQAVQSPATTRLSKPVPSEPAGACPSREGLDVPVGGSRLARRTVLQPVRADALVVPQLVPRESRGTARARPQRPHLTLEKAHERVPHGRFPHRGVGVGHC